MLIRPLVIAGFVTMSAFSLAACDTNDGPAEEIGEEIDDAADEVDDATD